MHAAKKIGSMALALIVTASLIAGCGTSGTAVKDEPSTKPAAPEITKDPVELTFHYPYGEGGFKPRFTIKSFQEKYPNVTLKLVPKIEPEMIATGNIPDIIMVNDPAAIYRNMTDGMAYDLTGLVKMHNFDLSRFEPSLLKTAQQYSDGKLYALPRARAVHALHYNKDIFDKFGVPYPSKDKPMTWDEVIDLSKKLTRNEGGVQYRGLDSGFLPLMLQQLIADTLDATTYEPRYSTDPKFKTFLEKVKTIFDVPEMFPGPDKTKFARSDMNNFLKEKNVAMVALWDSTAQLVPAEKNGSLKFDLAPFPVWKEYPGVNPIASAHHLIISKTSKNKDLAMEYFKYYFSDEHQTELSKLGLDASPLKSMEVNKVYKSGIPELANKNVQALFINTPAEATKPLKYSGADVLEAIKAVSKGDKDINSILRGMDEEARKKVAEQKAKEK